MDIMQFTLFISVFAVILIAVYSQFQIKRKTREIAKQNKVLKKEIAERKQAENALRESEAKYRRIFENSVIGFFQSTPDGRFLSVNSAFAKMLGYDSPKDLVSTITDIAAQYYVDPKDRDRYQAILRQKGEVENFEIKVKCKDGGELWVSNSARAYFGPDGKVFCYEGVVSNITERKQIEKELRESQAMFQAAMDHSHAGIAIADAPSGKLRYVNDSALGIRGKSREDIVNGVGIEQYVESWQILHFDGTPYKDDEVPLARAILYGEVCGEEFIIRRQDDEDRIVWANAAPIYDENGVISAGIVVFLDITEFKKVEQAQQKLQAQLNQAQKMESVGRLAGGVAHDFNNMLSIILGNAEMLMDDMALDDPLAAGVQEIQKAAERSADLTRQLLAFARKQTIAPKVLDLNKTLDGMLKMISRLIGEDIDLGWLPKSDLWPVKVDPSQIDQILANLCVNARDSIRGVGKITIETGNVNFDEEYCQNHEGFKQGDFAMIAVSDTGCGMDKDILENLFEPFFTTKAVGRGTGLGLATVYGIVKQNEGFINVYSEKDGGTTFKVYLPRYVGEAEQPCQTKLETPVENGRETILLVEDEPAILEMTAMMLRRIGYAVLAASGPKEALDVSRSHPGEVDLLMTDVVMPGMSGRDLADELTRHRPGIKCLFMSGYTANVIAHHGILNKGVQFIHKPFGKQELTAKVREALAS